MYILLLKLCLQFVIQCQQKILNVFRITKTYSFHTCSLCAIRQDSYLRNMGNAEITIVNMVFFFTIKVVYFLTLQKQYFCTRKCK